ncbi:MAG: hypothetical protein LBO03_06990 [Acidaminococcales bacterium]|jgi:hypothetical protein|nr:hypothetical protein [Acidaminococcales bacterium]
MLKERIGGMPWLFFLRAGQTKVFAGDFGFSSLRLFFGKPIGFICGSPPVRGAVLYMTSALGFLWRIV